MRFVCMELNQKQKKKLNAFAELFGVKAVILFGSAAKQKQKSFSGDIDIALILSDKNARKYEEDMESYSKLWLSLAGALDMTPDILDITFVSAKTPPLLAYYIAKDGKLLCGSGFVFSDFRLKAMRVFFDTVFFRNALDIHLRKILYAR